MKFLTRILCKKLNVLVDLITLTYFCSKIKHKILENFPTNTLFQQKKMPAKILIIFSLSKHKISCIGSVNAWWWSDSKNKYWKKSWISLYLEKSREVKKNFFPTVDLWRKPCKYSFVYNVFFLFYCVVTNLINFEIFHIQEAKTI